MQPVWSIFQAREHDAITHLDPSPPPLYPFALAASIALVARLIFKHPLFTPLCAAAVAFFATRVAKNLLGSYNCFRVVEDHAIRLARSGPSLYVIAAVIAAVTAWILPLVSIAFASAGAMLSALTIDVDILRAHYDHERANLRRHT